MIFWILVCVALLLLAYKLLHTAGNRYLCYRPDGSIAWRLRL